MALAALLAIAASPRDDEAHPGGADQKGKESFVAPASDEGKEAIARFRVPEGFKVELAAAEPLLANPVIFTLDEKGNLYVAETFRLHRGVTDNRGHMYWLDDDLAATTVADRVAMYKKHLKERAADYEGAEDRVRKLVDEDGDGVYDKATVFAGGFNKMEDGIGSGLLARGNTVWFTNIPDLWKLVDRDGDGVADERESLSTGYGVHVAFLGHDLHGLVMGPDGKLYFSVGDRGLNVRTKEGKQLVLLAQGAVLRCDPDGANLEIYATGLRNPQELAFDPYGNLITVDNNSDGGDKARLVDLVEGGDSGWRMGYQYMESPALRGPWNAENLWKPRAEGNDAAYLLPPLINVSDGPSGLTRDAGTGLPARLADKFFLADFRGTAGSSGIRAFGLAPDGASFKMVDQEQLFWSVLATDVALAPGGGLLVSDWTEGWGLSGKGRMYRLVPTEGVDLDAAKEVAEILAKGMGKRGIDELGKLLAHADYRVRLEAQFELAARALAAGADQKKKAEVIEALTFASRQPSSLFCRLHAVWGLGQIARVDASALTPVVDRLQDPDGRVRAQAAKVVGESRRGDLAGRVVPLLADPEPRTRLQAAIALGKLGDPSAVDPIARMLAEAKDGDPYLRHAGVMGLLGTADAAALGRLGRSPEPAVRLGALLVHRRRGSAGAAAFLADPEPRIALEAARAIYDADIAEALPALAAVEPAPALGEPMLRRIVAAAERITSPERLAAIAARADLPESVRADAIDALGAWKDPSGRDRVVGLWRPIGPRMLGPAVDALQEVAPDLLRAGPDAIRGAAAEAVARLGLAGMAPMLAQLAASDAGAEARVAGLKGLETLKAQELAGAVEAAVRDKDGRVRSEGLRLLAALDPIRAVPILSTVLKEGGLRERQAALGTLATLKTPEVDVLLATWAEKLADGDIPPALRLDLLEAVVGRDAAAIREQLARYEEDRDPERPLALYREAIEGGDARRGRRIFLERTEAQCLKCHKVGGQGGEVGPELAGIGAKKERMYILQSIVEPNAEIAEGFDTLVVATTDGQVHTGVVKDEKGEVLKLMDAEGKLIEIPKADIEDQKRGLSAMPQDLLKNLSPRDVRDLVEFLSGLR
jgi:quinoprotein glucose dehydrogenase